MINIQQNYFLLLKHFSRAIYKSRGQTGFFVRRFHIFFHELVEFTVLFILVADFQFLQTFNVILCDSVLISERSRFGGLFLWTLQCSFWSFN